MNNMTCNRNILTHKLRIINMGVGGLQKAKFYALLITLAILAGTLCLYPAISSLMNSVIIGSSGQISHFPNVTAESGSAKDIQAAVDWVVAHGGIGNVFIPEGVFDFVNVGEDWTGARVTIPAGVNVFGAPTERDAKGQVVEWKTVLRLPWDVPDGGWFKILGSGDPNKFSRFSDIKLVGYRSVDPNSTTIHQGIAIYDAGQFRVDHCYFEHICGGGIQVASSNSWVCKPNFGVIDHCFFVNPVGKVAASMYECTVGYGVMVYRANGDLWENDVSKVLGKYTDYTVFIEDCYFEKWRHCVAANSGAHYVFRHNIIKNDFGFGSLDAHGWFQTLCTNPQHGNQANPPAVYNGTAWVCGYEVIGNPGNICGQPLGGAYFRITQVGTRVIEIYNNEIIDCVEQNGAGVFVRGGSGIAFNNTVGGQYTMFLYFDNEARPEGAKVWCNDWWIWNNTMLGGCTEIYNLEPENFRENYEYFKRAPNLAQDGFDYQPYPYPHPLTIETSP